jgi:hypothetical protein
MKRALEPSRKTKGKITTAEIMAQMIDMHNFDTPLKIDGNVSFNTKTMSAKEVALKKRYF